MQPRQQVIDQFSTFLRFADDRAAGWAIDGRLRRSMQHCMTQLQQFDAEAFWSLYWHQRWRAMLEQSEQPGQSEQPEPSAPSEQPRELHLAQSHLAAYLQEPCYWATQSLLRRMARSQEILAECFQMAIARVPKVLRACNPNDGTSLKTYSKTAFENIIRDGLRQQYQINRCSDWALLLRVSTRQVREALEQTGFAAEKIALYLNAYRCYENGYWRLGTAAGRRIDRPDAAGWQILVQFYRQQHPQPEMTAALLESQLVDCAARVRAYLHPAIVSLNAPRSEQSGEWQDDLPTLQDEPLAELIAGEEAVQRQEQQCQLNKILLEAIAQLEPELQTLLALYYQQNLTQQQIAQSLHLQQYTVSRRLNKARAKLLLALGQWQQGQVHIELTSAVIKSISALLEEWLHQRWQILSPSSPDV